MSKGLVVEYGDVVERCGDRAIAYAEYAQAANLSASILDESFHVDGTRLVFVLSGTTPTTLPALVSVTPAERTTLALPMIVACMQVLAVMAEGVLGVNGVEGANATEEILNTRRSLDAVRTALREVLGHLYPLLLDIGAGPEICAEFDDGRHVAPQRAGTGDA